MRPEYTQKLEDAWLRLLSIPGLTYTAVTALLRYFGSPHAVFAATQEDLALFQKSGLTWIKALQKELTCEAHAARRQELKEKGIGFVSRDHPRFPKELRGLADPPYGLFYKGRLPAPNAFRVAIVGARKCSFYGADQARCIASLLAAQGIDVISGMAKGIDGIAQRAAIAAGGMSYAYLGCGVDVCYPKENLDLYLSLSAQGGILSEYACGQAPEKYHFPQRNRLISGISDVVVIIEAREKSGSLITAEYALDQGKEVFALPGRSTDALSGGCNRLIRDGAGVILSPELFLEQMLGMKEKKQQQRKKEKEAAQRKQTRSDEREMADPGKGESCEKEDAVTTILDLLEYTPVSLEELCIKTGMDPAALHSILLSLVLSERAVEVGKGQYIRNTPCTL